MMPVEFDAGSLGARLLHAMSLAAESDAPILASTEVFAAACIAAAVANPEWAAAIACDLDARTRELGESIVKGMPAANWANRQDGVTASTRRTHAGPLVKAS